MVRHVASSCSRSRLNRHLKFYQHISKWVPPVTFL